MAGFEPATSCDTGPQLPAPLTTWNTCVGQIAQNDIFRVKTGDLFFVFCSRRSWGAFLPECGGVGVRGLCRFFLFELLDHT